MYIDGTKLLVARSTWLQQILHDYELHLGYRLEIEHGSLDNRPIRQINHLPSYRSLTLMPLSYCGWKNSCTCGGRWFIPLNSPTVYNIFNRYHWLPYVVEDFFHRDCVYDRDKLVQQQLHSYPGRSAEMPGQHEPQRRGETARRSVGCWKSWLEAWKMRSWFCWWKWHEIWCHRGFVCISIINYFSDICKRPCKAP